MATLDHYLGEVIFPQPSGPVMYGHLSSASSALTNVITFLNPYNINDAMMLGAQRFKDLNFPLSAYPMTDQGYFDAKDELLLQSLCQVGASDSVDIHRVTHEALRAKLDPVDYKLGVRCASQLIEACWPSNRKIKNVVLGNWPEFDSLHSHVSTLSTIFMEHDQRRQGKGRAQELLNDAYVRILLQSTW